MIGRCNQAATMDVGGGGLVEAAGTNGQSYAMTPNSLNNANFS